MSHYQRYFIWLISCGGLGFLLEGINSKKPNLVAEYIALGITWICGCILYFTKYTDR
jgi:hypothetical protein